MKRIKWTFKKVAAMFSIFLGCGMVVSCYGMPMDEEVIEEPVMYGMPPNHEDLENESAESENESDGQRFAVNEDGKVVRK